MNAQTFFFQSAMRAVRRAAQIAQKKQLPVVDVIFFPFFGHKPLVRIDGDTLSSRVAQRLTYVPQIFVRTKNNAKQFLQTYKNIVRQNKNRAVRLKQSRGTLFDKQCLAFAREISLKTQAIVRGYCLWEIDVDFYTTKITLRYIPRGRTTLRQKKFKRGIFCVERNNTPTVAEARLLLRLLDETKQHKRNFLTTTSTK